MNMVTINVGGKLFTTSKDTLYKASYFKDLPLEDNEYAKNAIDRNPDNFSYLLDCLRDHRYINYELLERYKPDIDYFGMDCLLKQLETLTPTITGKDDNFELKKTENVVILYAKKV